MCYDELNNIRESSTELTPEQQAVINSIKQYGKQEDMCVLIIGADLPVESKLVEDYFARTL